MTQRLSAPGSGVTACAAEEGKRAEKPVNRRTGRLSVLRFGIEAANEDADNRDRRKFYESHPERFIAIPRITFETQLDWMREYSESLEDKRHARVLLSLRVA